MSEQYVRVSRELLSRITAQFMFSLRDSDYQVLCALLAAPPEDVRAVVDEPVAWRCGGITWSYQTDAMKHAERFSLGVEPLYRHPQRPVVMPEREDAATYGEVPFVEGWNACLDRIAEKNK